MALNPSTKDRYRAVACRECRRSKTKCNRSWPCQACIKRGCEDICPDGILIKPKRDKPTGSLEAADLREENQRLMARIRELENAASISPLSLDASSPSHSDPCSSSSKQAGTDGSHHSQQEEIVNAFGTLSIGELGQSNHHNQAAGAEYLLDVNSDSSKFSRIIPKQIVLEGLVLPSEILHLAEFFPIGSSVSSPPELRHFILSCIPPADKTLGLVERYYRHIAWMYDPVPREQFMDRVYDRIFYSNRYGDVANVPFDHVALLFIILALSVLLDLDRPFNYEDSEPYYMLALAAFVLETHLTAPTLASIQSLHLTCIYTCLAEKTTAEERWLLMGTNIRMVQSAGLYRDFSRWLKCDPAETERRRKLFWEIFVYDTWLSFVMGRPAALANNNQIETKYPQDLHTTLTAAGEPEPSFHHWKYKFAKEIVSPLLDEVLGAEPPAYNSILRIDASIRRFPVPLPLQAPSLDGDGTNRDTANVSSCMQKYFIIWLKETSLLSLHRSFFAHAISVSPDNPLQSKYAPSVLAVFRSASLVVRHVRQLHLDHPLTARIWSFWSSVFSAAISLGTLVVRSPRSQFSQCALQDIDLACELMEQGISTPRSVKAAVILRKLQTKAHDAFVKYGPGHLPGGPAERQPDLGEDELSIFGGQTRLVLATSLKHTGRNTLHESTHNHISVETSEPLQSSFHEAHPELWTENSALTLFEGLSDMMSGNSKFQGTDGIVPDLSGLGYGMDFSPNLQDVSFAASTGQQGAATWQDLMSELGMENME